MEAVQNAVDQIIPIILQLFGAGATFLLIHKVAQLARDAVKQTLEQQPITPQVAYVLSQVVYYSITIFAVLMAIDLFDEPIVESLFSVLIFVVVAMLLGFGKEYLDTIQKLFTKIFGEYSVAKENIEAITASERLNRLELFNVQDFVEVTGGVRGTVREINEFHTTLVTADQQTIVLPNRLIVNDKIVNYGLEPTRRLDLVYRIGYEANLLQAKQILQEIICQSKFVLNEPEPPLIGVTELADSSVNFLVRIHVLGKNIVVAPLEINEQVKLQFDAANISIPYPQQKLHVHQVAQPDTKLVNFGKVTNGTRH